LESSKFRLISIFLVATLIVVAGCSIVAFRANAQTQMPYKVLLRQRHQAGACVNVGTITVDRTPYALPATVMLAVGDHALEVPLPSGCEFVMWELEGAVSINGGDQGRAVAPDTYVLTVRGEGTVRLVNKGSCCGVGGIMAPANPIITLAPYLVAVGLIATTAAVAVKRRRN
jgi:hypothetical protein